MRPKNSKPITGHCRQKAAQIGVFLTSAFFLCVARRFRAESGTALMIKERLKKD
jgi:hypothetical protein